MLSKSRLSAAIAAAFRAAEPGEDSVDQLADALAQAVIDEIKAGEVTVTVTGGACSYSGVHPPVTSKGTVS